MLAQSKGPSLGVNPKERGTKVSGQMHRPHFSVPLKEPISLTQIKHPDGRLSSYPPPENWEDWVEYDGKSWPERIPRHYHLVPTICFNCESACGLLAYVDKETFDIKKFEGNPAHPGSRGRNCAKGPATHNQVYDPERILHPLKRVGKRGEGKWKRITWDQALNEISEKMRASHAGMWVGFRQPVQRVAMEKAGKKVAHSFETNPGEVWEENEFWVELSGRMDPDGSLGIRQYVESKKHPGQLISQDEYWSWIFEHSLPGLPEKAALEKLTPLQYMRKYGAYEIKAENYKPFMQKVDLPEGHQKATNGCAYNSKGERLATIIDGVPYLGFNTPSGRLEFFTRTLSDWGWPELEHVVPWPLKSHVHPSELDSEAGEMVLLPNFRLPTLIHTRSANCKWLYEISHNNPVWVHPQDATKLGIRNGDLIRIETEIGWFVDKAWITEGIKPGIIAMSHHLGRWRLQTSLGGNPGMSALASLDADKTKHTLNILEGGMAWESNDPDTSRIWWKDIGVHQNLTHAVQPDPISGAHCWLQKVVDIRKAKPDEAHGTVHVDTEKSFAIYKR